jgi:hypothetical protein
MARSELYRAGKCAVELGKMLKGISEDQGLEGWVQAKITKAADYLESVYNYLNYEMQNTSDEVSEASVAAYGPGDDPENPERDTTDGEPLDPGQASPTPQSGGATPTQTSDGMVKMVKLGLDRKPIGTPIMVRNTDIKIKQQQGYTVIGESASAGASSAGGIAAGGFGNGFLNGGPGTITRYSKKKKKKATESVGANISTPTMRAKISSKFGHDPDRAATVYKANKYNPKTGLGGYVAPRGDTTDKSNILLQLKSNLDTATGNPLYFQDGSTLAIKPSIARSALAKIEGMLPVEKHETIKNLMTSKDAFVSFVKGQTEGTMSDAEKESEGPKFTGYWKGTDKGRPGNKMVGSGS